MAAPHNSKRIVVLDNSAAIAILMADEKDSEYAQTLLQKLDQIRFIAPVLWRYEFANTIRMIQKRNRIVESELVQLFADMEALQIEVVEDIQSPGVLREISQAHDVTAYDAAYLELALRRNVAIATCDKQLKAAAIAASIKLI
jgi:predicted nucleic acid-binding protein